MRLRRKSDPEPSLPEVSESHVDVEGGQVDVMVEEMPSAPVVVLAAVNLLPPSYARRAAVRRARTFAILCVFVAALISALGWMVAHQKQVAAQEALDVATAERVALQAEAAKYADVPRVLATVAAAEGQLEVAMGNEVRWSFFLNDLALTMPSGVALTSLQVGSPGPGAPVQATAPSSTATAGTGTGSSGAGVPGIGTMTVSAQALSYNKVATWLDSLAKLPTLSDPYVGTMSVGELEGREIVNYPSTATITTSTLSGRYRAQAGGTP